MPKSRAGLSSWPCRRAPEERWQLTELLTPQSSDWKRHKEGSEDEKGPGSVLYSVCSPHYPLSCFSLLGINAQDKYFLNLADEWIRQLWYIHTMEYYSDVKKSAFESVLIRWMNLELLYRVKQVRKRKTNAVY